MSQDAHITPYGQNEWPFTADPTIGITVPGTGPGGAGRKSCDLKSNLNPNTYYYWVDICPTLGSPQSVTIP